MFWLDVRHGIAGVRNPDLLQVPGVTSQDGQKFAFLPVTARALHDNSCGTKPLPFNMGVRMLLTCQRFGHEIRTVQAEWSAGRLRASLAPEAWRSGQRGRGHIQEL